MEEKVIYDRLYAYMWSEDGKESIKDELELLNSKFDEEEDYTERCKTLNEIDRVLKSVNA